MNAQKTNHIDLKKGKFNRLCPIIENGVILVGGR